MLGFDCVTSLWVYKAMGIVIEAIQERFLQQYKSAFMDWITGMIKARVLLCSDPAWDTLKHTILSLFIPTSLHNQGFKVGLHNQLAYIQLITTCSYIHPLDNLCKSGIAVIFDSINLQLNTVKIANYLFNNILFYLKKKT